MRVLIHRTGWRLAWLLLGAAPSAYAQPIWPKGTARVLGVIMDSVSGRPILRSRVCRIVPLNAPYGEGQVCASPDSTGRYVMDSLPEGPQALWVSCDGAQPFLGRRLRTDTLLVGPGQEAHLDVIVPALTCDMRPLLATRGVFRGIYRVGFEESRFVSCDTSVSAWATYSSTLRASRPPWPKPNNKYYPTYYVEWEGILRGPWRYGHMGVSEYELTVDRVLTIRRPTRADCRAVR